MKLVPLLSIPLLLYILGVHTHIPVLAFTEEAYGSLTLPSGAPWTIRGFDVFVALSTLFLIVEITKGIRLEKRSLSTILFEHVFSAVLCVVCMVLFLMVESYGTSHVLLLSGFAVCDVVVGILISERLQRLPASGKA